MDEHHAPSDLGCGHCHDCSSFKNVSCTRPEALRLDESQQSAERRLAQSVITTLVSNLQKSTADYANWDDMYDQFSTGPDPQWVKENLGPYAIGTFGLSHILVLSASFSRRGNVP